MTDVPLLRPSRHAVLVIEDDASIRQLRMSLLQRDDCAVRMAAAGETGPASARTRAQARPD
jgi:DNA-binding NtrC family response regulator